MMKSTDIRQAGIRKLAVGDLQDIPPRPRRGVNRIETSREPVKVRGEALNEVWWRGKQWAVTAYGIEYLDGTYVAEASRLAEQPDYPWPMHMAEKTWVDIDDFTTAWMAALLLHGKADKVDPVAVREMFGRLRPPRVGPGEADG
jgi:hypothetical protein